MKGLGAHGSAMLRGTAILGRTSQSAATAIAMRIQEEAKRLSGTAAELSLEKLRPIIERKYKEIMNLVVQPQGPLQPARVSVAPPKPPPVVDHEKVKELKEKKLHHV